MLAAGFAFARGIRLLDLFNTSDSGEKFSCNAVLSESIDGRGYLLTILEKKSPVIRIKRRERAPYRMRR
jgi:hypothetical protein